MWCTYTYPSVYQWITYNSYCVLLSFSSMVKMIQSLSWVFKICIVMKDLLETPSTTFIHCQFHFCIFVEGTQILKKLYPICLFWNWTHTPAVEFYGKFRIVMNWQFLFIQCFKHFTFGRIHTFRFPVSHNIL